MVNFNGRSSRHGDGRIWEDECGRDVATRVIHVAFTLCEVFDEPFCRHDVVAVEIGRLCDSRVCD